MPVFYNTWEGGDEHEFIRASEALTGRADTYSYMVEFLRLSP